MGHQNRGDGTDGRYFHATFALSGTPLDRGHRSGANSGAPIDADLRGAGAGDCRFGRAVMLSVVAPFGGDLRVICWQGHSCLKPCGRIAAG